MARHKAKRNRRQQRANFNQAEFDLKRSQFDHQVKTDNATLEQRKQEEQRRQAEFEHRQRSSQEARKRQQRTDFNRQVDEQSKAIGDTVDSVASVPKKAVTFGSKLSLGALFGFLILFLFLTLIKVQIGGKSYSRLGLIGLAMMGRASIA